MLTPYFLHHRKLLGDLARLAYETVREMMAASTGKTDARPYMVAVNPDLRVSPPFIHPGASHWIFRARRLSILA